MCRKLMRYAVFFQTELMKGVRVIKMKLNNGIIEIEVSEHGAELKSVIRDGREYMWCGDAKYWGRTSPVLFPFVGGLKDKRYLYNGRAYPMGQHGFARDCDFEMVEQGENFVEYELTENDETLAKYPFKFKLTIKYTLKGSSVLVEWRVINKGNERMSFSIGAHPAFSLKDGENFFIFDTDDDITYRLLDENGLLVPDKDYTLKNNGGSPIVKGMFDRDAFIIEDEQAKSVSLCGADKRPYVTVRFTAPLFGLWSPAGKDAPFVCIEPWYGRCDRNDFDGELSEREYSMMLGCGEQRSFRYEIEFG